MIETLIGATLEAVAASDDRREWAVNRPSRSVAAVRESALPPRGWEAFVLQFGASKAQAKAVRVYLSGLGRIEKWPALYQRIVFAEVVEDGLWRHWTLPGSRCQGLVP